MVRSVAIFGLGNPLMSDEGIGISVLQALGLRDDLPATVELIDLGTGGMSLLHETAGRLKLIFIDCAFMDQPAGTLIRFSPEDVRSRDVRMRWSLHEGDLLATLALAAAVGECPDDVIIFGIQPANVEPGQTLSPALAKHLTSYVDQVITEAKGDRSISSEEIDLSPSC
jgi:hydrogenase maturation protease